MGQVNEIGTKAGILQQQMFPRRSLRHYSPKLNNYNLT